MHGRKYSTLLALSFVILTQGRLLGQADESRFSQDFPPLVDHAIPMPGRPTLPAQPPLPRSTFGFPQLARAAGMVFSGTVTGVVRHPAGHGNAVETVAVTFRVENAIRGASPGASLTISEWIGLWSGGQRYRMGERVLLFLYGPSKLGLTSCVGGGLGHFRIDSGGRVMLSAAQLSAFREDPVLGGKSRAPLSDFAWAVRRASEEEAVQ